MKHVYKKLFSCIFLLLNLQLMAQEKPTVYVGAGLSAPYNTAENPVSLKPNTGLQLGGYLPVFNQRKVSFGLNLTADYLFGSKNTFKESPEGFNTFGQLSNLVSRDKNTKLKQQILKIGFGPQLNFKAGSKLLISPIVQAGISAFSQNPFSFIQDFDLGKNQFSKEIFRQEKIKNNSFFVMPRLKLSYPIAKDLGIWAETNYTFSEIKQGQQILVPANPPVESNLYTIEDIMGGTYKDVNSSTKRNALGINLGLSYSFGKEKVKKVTTKTDQAGQGLELIKKSAPQKSGTVVFNNPAKKEHKNLQKLIALTPKNNSRFSDFKSIKAFTWQLVGQNIPKASYLIEVIKISSKGQPQRSYTAKTDKTSIPALSLFKENQPMEGQYQWQVTEITTGITSNPSFFSMSNCEIQFTITNETIECLGYEGPNRKYKICFESTYSSPSGDLTYINPGSGLSVYDQLYAPLSYTLVGSNISLVSQSGAASSTQSYCFEVIVPSSVTSIGFGLQGDDLDPSPVLCQPGVSLVLDELPDCLCNECEKMEVSFNNFSISPNGTSGKQFNFNGNIQVNQPIYGMEFQVQSYAFTAAPGPCTNGVTSIEESGMILMPGTTINGSSTLQLYNESVSGNPASNVNATKIVKYSSNTALNGNIPVNLNIGLPGPLTGLTPGCCTINYRVCIKVKVFYDEGNCKSCVFTHCFEFNNQ